MKKFSAFLLVAILGVAACDLQPKITSLPDTVGEFISARYPALLADPNAQPEIYNSAATDYGVYAAPEVYGTDATGDDYVLYSSVDDYIVPPQPVEESTDDNTPDATDDDAPDEMDEFVGDDVDDTLVVPDNTPDGTADEDDIAWDEHSKTDDKLNIPMYGGADEYTEIAVVRGDTLYLLGKKYNMTVEEIAKENNLTAPYLLRVGQKLRVRVPTEQAIAEIKTAPATKSETKAEVKPEPKPESKVEAKAEPKPKAEPAHKTTTRVDVGAVTVAPGDTLYSLSRKYSIPVNDLAVINNLTPPFALYAGQTLRVPDLSSAPVRTAKAATTAPAKAAPKAETKMANHQSAKVTAKQANKPATKPEQKSATKSKATNQDKKPKEQTTKKQTATKTTQIKSSTKAPTIAARSASKFSWPVRGRVLSNYGAKNGGLFNDGINIGANVGTSVLAAENGVVAYAGNEVKGMGNLVIIQHSDGWMTVYAHMDSLGVRRGTNVRVGQKIGTVGKTGKVDKPQLHFEIRRGTRAYNPIQYLKK